MSKKKTMKSKKECLPIYKFMRNWLNINDSIWNKLHHGEMKTYLLVKGHQVPPNASMALAEKQDHIENDFIYVRDYANSISCYHNPKPFHPKALLQELQSVSQEELLERRKKVLQQMGYRYDQVSGNVTEVTPQQLVESEEYFVTEKINRYKQKTKLRKYY